LNEWCPGEIVSRKNGILLLRTLLLIWLAVSVKNTDDLYGVRYSMRSFEQCKKVVDYETSEK